MNSFDLALVNSVIMVCWTALALHFDKWWIALIAGLFLFYCKKGE